VALKEKIVYEKAPDASQPLSVHKLKAFVGGAPVLKDISFDISPGEILGIVGVNGAGKTTLVNVLSGIGDVSAKENSKNIDYDYVYVDDVDLMSLSPQQRYEAGIHFVFEGRRLFPDLTVRENLEIAMPIKESKHSEKRIAEILELFPKMEALLELKAKNCSGGQQQIVAISRAIMQYPKVLVMDEPTLGLSPTSIEAVKDVLKILSSGSVSILILEQRASFIDSIATRRMNLQRGMLNEPINVALRAGEWKPKEETIAQPVIAPALESTEEIDEDDEWKPI